MCLSAQSCLTLWDPMDCNPQAPLSKGILKARILEWVVIPFSGGSCQPRDQTQVSCIADGFSTVWATMGSPYWKYVRLRSGDHRMFTFVEAQELMSRDETSTQLESRAQRTEAGVIWKRADTTPGAPESFSFRVIFPRLLAPHLHSHHSSVQNVPATFQPTKSYLIWLSASLQLNYFLHSPPCSVPLTLLLKLSLESLSCWCSL